MLWSPTETVLRGLERSSSRTLLERNGGELVVLNQRDLSPEEELTTDLHRHPHCLRRSRQRTAALP